MQSKKKSIGMHQTVPFGSVGCILYQLFVEQDGELLNENKLILNDLRCSWNHFKNPQYVYRDFSFKNKYRIVASSNSCY